MDITLIPSVRGDVVPLCTPECAKFFIGAMSYMDVRDLIYKIMHDAAFRQWITNGLHNMRVKATKAWVPE